MASLLPAIDHSSSLKGRCISLLQDDQNTSCWQAGQKRSQNIFSWGGQDEIHFLGFQIFPYDMHLHTFQESFQNLPGTVTLSRLTWRHHSMTVHWHCPSLTLPPFFNRRALRMVDRCARACAIYKGPSTSSASPSPQSILTSRGPRKSIQDEVDPPNKSGHVLLANVPNKVWAALGVLKSMLSTFF